MAYSTGAWLFQIALETVLNGSVLQDTEATVLLLLLEALHIIVAPLTEVPSTLGLFDNVRQRIINLGKVHLVRTPTRTPLIQGLVLLRDLEKARP